MTILLAVSVASGQQNQEQTLDSLMTEAAQAQAAKQYSAAADAYRRAAVIRPDVAEIWANLGLMRHESGDYAAAIESFRKANDIKPSLYVPNLFLGIDLFDTGRAKESLPWLLRASAMNRSDAEAYLFLGRAYALLGKPAQAVEAMDHAVQLDPARSQLWFYLGMMRLDQVEDESRTLAAVGHDSTWARTLYAESLLRQSRYHEAVEVLKNVQASAEPAPCVHAELGLADLMTHDIDQARTQLESVDINVPSCILLGQVRLQVETGQYDAALPLLQKLWDRDPGFVRSMSPLFMEGIQQEAAARFTALLERASGSGQLSVPLATSIIAAVNDTPQTPALAASSPATHRSAAAAYAAGHYGECARRAAENAVMKDGTELRLLTACSFLNGDDAGAARSAALWLGTAPHSIEALYWSVKANEQLADQALEHFEQMEPNSEQTHLLLGDSYRQRKLFDNARTEYRKALEIQPNDPAALLGLASADFGVGDSGDAVKTAQAALDQRPSDSELNLLMGEVLVEQHSFAQAEPYLNRSLAAKPQMVTRVHALLGRVYEETGRTTQALEQLRLGLPSDTDGTVHYQLARVYRQMGDEKDASVALTEMKELQQHRRQTASLAMEDSHAPELDDRDGGPER